MRFVMIAALAVLTLGFFDAPQAQAGWKCIGAEYVCGSPKKKAYKKSYKKKAAYKKKSKKRYAKKSYSKKKYAKKTSTKKRYAKKSNSKKKYASKKNYGGGSTGIASYYWQGQMTASGERFNPGALTAAHRSLPFGTRVRVTNHSNGRSVVVRINDRGPFIKGRIIDLSSAAAGVIGMKGAGLARVSVKVVGGKG